MRLHQVFGANVRRLRKARGLTQEQLAHDLDIDVSYLGQIERGERNTTLGIVEKAAEAFQLPAADLLVPPVDGTRGGGANT